jgi:lipopolysaccharide/colanic/teichoic acid biosynthesis glycosyltransferase
LLLLLALLHGVRDYAWLGETASSIAARIIPQGVPLIQLLPAVLLGLIALNTYGGSHRRRDASRLVAGVTLGLAFPFWAKASNQHLMSLALPGFTLIAVLTGTALMVERRILGHLTRKFWLLGPGPLRALLIARPSHAQRALEHPTLRDAREFAFEASFDPDALGLSGADGGFRRLCQAVKQNHADTLVFSGAMEDKSLAVISEVAGATGCQLYALTRRFSGIESPMVMRHSLALVTLNQAARRGGQLLLKRALDIVGAVLSLLILSPLMAAIAIAIRIDTRGPAVFSQRRVGRDGRFFRCYKFRSMKQDAEEHLRSNEELYDEYRRNHFKLSLDRDPRLTRIGRILRKASLDELPQFWNVLIGNMSLVGPRPVVPEELALYGERVPLFLSIKPGMTGAWAVEGRSRVGYPDRARIELSYVLDWSLGTDLSLLLKTIPAVLYMRGAN